jgi:negative regulator of flagellin synthesis FlgM
MVKVNNIDNLHGNDAIGAIKRGATEKAGSASEVGKSEVKATLGKDTVSVSDKSAEFGKLIDQIKQLPDVRQDRVDELKQRIAAGDYHPSAEEIADALLKDE